MSSLDPKEKPPLPDHPHSLAFRAVESILKGDARLSNFIRTWKTWQGRPDDRQEPAINNLPWLRMTPFPTGSGLIDELRHREPLVILLELATPGTMFEWSANSWRAVELALFQTENPEQAQVNMQKLLACGCTTGRPTITQPAIKLQKDSSDPITFATGHILLDVKVNT